MTKLLKFSLTALFAATLAACGSSGGSSDDNNSANNNGNVNSQNNANNATPPQQAPTAPKAVLNANIASSGLKSGAVTNEAVTVDGKTFPIAIPGVNARGGLTNWGGNLLGVTSVIIRENDGAQYFGFVADTTESQRYAYYGSSQAETSVMPTTGVARYEGDVIYSYGGQLEAGEVFAEGDVKLTADFGTKKITGTIDDVIGGAGPELTADVKADISGSAFTGTVTTSSKAAALSGKFFGASANSVAGVFDDGKNTLSGAFTADK